MQDTKPVITPWPVDPYTIAREHAEARNEQPLYVLPHDWESLLEDEYARAAMATRLTALEHRLAAYEQRTEIVRRDATDTTDWERVRALAPKGDYPYSRGIPTVAEWKPDTNWIWDICPLCEVDLYNEDGTCTGCAFNGGQNFSADYEHRAPTPKWGARQSMSPYRNYEQAGMSVTYHEGEPVSPEQPAVAWDTYPASWDHNIVDHGGVPTDWRRVNVGFDEMSTATRRLQRVLDAEVVLT